MIIDTAEANIKWPRGNGCEASEPSALKTNRLVGRLGTFWSLSRIHMFCAQRNPYAAWLFMCAVPDVALDSAFWLSGDLKQKSS
jgi:hypothetical protein